MIFRFPSGRISNPKGCTVDKEFFLQELSGMVSEKRYAHSLRCADLAVLLAEMYGADPDKAWIAGLMHDISKGQGRETIQQWALWDKGSLSDYEKQHFNVLHSYASAWYLENRLGIEDESILNAVRFHTTGFPSMDLLAKVVFAADYMEPGREHLSDDDVKQLIQLPIDKLVTVILEATEKYLSSKGIFLSPDSRELYLLLTKR
jgi:predicted HD superfamily hydrolase involved in NAD metabolism